MSDCHRLLCFEGALLIGSAFRKLGKRDLLPVEKEVPDFAIRGAIEIVRSHAITLVVHGVDNGAPSRLAIIIALGKKIHGSVMSPIDDFALKLLT